LFGGSSLSRGSRGNLPLAPVNEAFGRNHPPATNEQSTRRILHVVFSARMAGSERYCVDLANRQAALGHEVHVACMGRSPIPHALAPAIKIHPFGRFFRGFQLRRLVRRLNPEICHAHLSAACKALGNIRGPHKSVATLHVGYKAHQHARLDGLICVNHAQAGRLSGYPGIARTIANWMPAAPALVPMGIREELGLDPDLLLIGAVGRLHESKGADVLVSAFRKVAPPRSALVIFGEGPQRAELERLKAGDPRIHFVGYRPNIQGYLRDLDLFVSPSREESFGLAIVEAMGVGLPIIATAAEGPAEYLRNQPARLVAPGSVDELAAALVTAQKAHAIGELRRIAYNLNLFNPVARVANIMDFYSHVIVSRPAAATVPVASETVVAT
jgi:glycosyltransferase involved in cell wall biosynthesis